MPLKFTIQVCKDGEQYYVNIPRRMREAVGKARAYFSKRVDADQFAESLGRDLRQQQHNSYFFRLDTAEQVGIMAAYEKAETAARLQEFVRFALENQPKEPATLKELAIRAVASKEKGQKSEKHVHEMRRVLQKFGEHNNRWANLAHEIQPKHVEEWLDSHPEWGQHTRKDYLKYIRAMFSYGVKQGLLTSNPAAKIEHFEIHETPPVIFSPEEAEAWMRAGETTDPALVQFMAICLFGGLRCADDSEACRIAPDDIREGVLRVQGKKTRAANRRLVSINPTLAAWLSRYPGDFNPTNLRKRLDTVYAASGLQKWAQSITRHTYVSYSVPVHGAERTAQEAGHSVSVLRRRYLELVTRAEAERFWAILPSGEALRAMNASLKHVGVVAITPPELLRGLSK
jgi:integrase